MKYEYGVMYKDGEIHRWGYSEEEAEEWVREWIDADGNPEAFKVCRRLIGEWEVV